MLGLPVKTRMARATTGRPSRTNTFHSPDTSVYRTYSLVPTPQPDSIAQLTPIATAPPPGSVFATALEPRFTVAAFRSRSDGITAAIISQVVTRLATIVRPITPSQGQVIARRLSQTAP